MDINSLINDLKTKLNQAVDHFDSNLRSIRTGRASAGILDGVMVEAYGTKIPLKQAGNIVVAEAQLIQITPFDPANLAAISSAIRSDSNLGLNPSDDGRVVRISIPPLTEERRRELAKQVSSKQEDSMISIRNYRHEAIDQINKNKKDKAIGEDEAKRFTAQVEDQVNVARESIEKLAKAKEDEILKL